ncbi:MAG: starch-binding protein [Acholeplasma sp.]|nr:starch-binding protein [Acholeplasma sp.]
MKKILLAVLVFITTTFVLTTNNKVYAEEIDSKDDVVLLYLEAPEGWDSPNVWSWNEAGENAFGTLGWPGKKMIKDTNNSGWFYLYVPATMEKVIISNGDKQTEAFDIDGKNVWITVGADPTDETKLLASLSETQATTGNLPEYVATIYILALVPIDWDSASLWAWTHPAGVNAFPDATWPGVEMKLLDDEWFILEVPAVANRVIVTNNAKTDALQTIDIDLLGGDNYIVVGEANAEGKFAVEIYKEKPIIIEDGVTINVTVPSTWTAPNAWAWSHPDGTNLYPAWPGEALTFNETSSTWTLIVPTWVNKVIINNEIDGTVVQTVDIDLPTEGEEFNLLIKEANAEGKYEFEINVAGNETPVEPVDPEDPENDLTWLYISLGVLAALGVAVAVFLVMKKKRA